MTKTVAPTRTISSTASAAARTCAERGVHFGGARGGASALRYSVLLGASATASRRWARASSRRPSILSDWPRPKWPYCARRIDVEQLAEGLRRALVLAAVVVGARQRLDDRALARLEPVGALEQHGGLGVVARLRSAPARWNSPYAVSRLGELVEPLLVLGIHPRQLCHGRRRRAGGHDSVARHAYRSSF